MGERGEGGDRELAHGGTKGGATLAEDQPRKGEEVGRKDGRTLSVKLWKEGEGKVMLGGCERLMPWEFDTSCSDFENTAPTSQALHQIKSSLQSAC